MSDKVQKIKDWVKNLKSQASTIPNLGINALAGFQLACDDVIAFIDSIPKEFGCEVNCTTKSEDLEEAVSQYVLGDFHERSRADFIAGAEWQKQQMMKNAVDATILDVDAQTIEFGLWPEKLLDIKEGDRVKIIIVKED